MRRVLLLLICGLLPVGAEAPVAIERHAALESALLEGVGILRGLVAASEDGYAVVPPRLTLTDFENAGEGETITRRYRLERRKYPVYEYEYEEVEVLALVKEPGASDGVWKKVTQTRIKDRKQVGEEWVEVKVYDEDGPHQETYTPTEWTETTYTLLATPHGFVASNAASLVALRRAGVPHDDPVSRALALALSKLVVHTDLPDTTWDLAWFAYAMLHERGAAHDEQLAAALVKLLAGMAREGDCAGMWGPVCIDRETLARAIKVDLLIDGAWNELRAALDRRPDDRGLRSRLSKATDVRNLHRYTMRSLSRQGLRYAEFDTPLMTDPGLAANHQMSFPGLPYDIYHLQLTDLETTALVLEVLAQAQRRGLLPEELPAVELPNGKPVRRAQQVSKLLRETIDALERLQRSDGSFDAGNRVASLGLFDRIGIETLPPRPQPAGDFRSPRGDRYTVLGARALAALHRLVGEDRRAHREVAEMLARSREALSGLDLVEEAPGDPPPPPTRERDGFDQVIPDDGLWLDRPWPPLPMLAGSLARDAAGDDLIDPELRRRVRDLVLRRLGPGGWGRGAVGLPHSSLRAWYLALGPAAAAVGPVALDAPPESREALWAAWCRRYAAYLDSARWRHESWSRPASLQIDAGVFETALAVIALADLARAPAVASDDADLLAAAAPAAAELFAPTVAPACLHLVPEGGPVALGCRLLLAGDAVDDAALIGVMADRGLVIDLAGRELAALAAVLGHGRVVERSFPEAGLGPKPHPAIVDPGGRPVLVSVSPEALEPLLHDLLAAQAAEGVLSPTWLRMAVTEAADETPDEAGPDVGTDPADGVELDDGDTVTIDDLLE